MNSLITQEHGTLAAANHYTAKLNNPLAESSVRNFVRYYSRNISAALQDEVGKFAFHLGVDECLRTYKGKLVNKTLIVPLVNLYLSFYSFTPVSQ